MISNRRFITTLYTVAPPQSMGHSLAHPIGFFPVNFGRKARSYIRPDQYAPKEGPRITTGRPAGGCPVTFPDTPGASGRYPTTMKGKTLRQNNRMIISTLMEAGSPFSVPSLFLSL